MLVLESLSKPVLAAAAARARPSEDEGTPDAIPPVARSAPATTVTGPARPDAPPLHASGARPACGFAFGICGSPNLGAEWVPSRPRLARTRPPEGPPVPGGRAAAPCGTATATWPGRQGWVPAGAVRDGRGAGAYGPLLSLAIRAWVVGMAPSPWWWGRAAQPDHGLFPAIGSASAYRPLGERALHAAT